MILLFNIIASTIAIVIAAWFGLDNIFGPGVPTVNGFLAACGIFVVVVCALYAYGRAKCLAYLRETDPPEEPRYIKPPKTPPLYKPKPVYGHGPMDMRKLKTPFMGIRRY